MPDGTPLSPETAIFLSVTKQLSVEYVGDLARWTGSPFAWILALPSRAKGAVGEKLVAEWLIRSGFRVSRPTHSGCDRVVNGVNVEIKFSTLWKSGGYTFQQLREQDYEFVFCLGISPQAVQAWLIPKKLAWEKGTPQHASGQDTRWFSFQAADPPEWIKPYGGSLDDVLTCLRQAIAG